MKAEVFSSGGGVQSSAIAALIIQGKLPKPDLVVIADTEMEVATTWEYLDRYVRPGLASVGVSVERVRCAEWESVPEHGDRWRSHKGSTILFPVFTNQSGQVAKLSGFCSARWKQEVIDRYLSKTHGLTRSKYRKWIGFSLDEVKRAVRMMVSEEGKAGLIRHPLIEDLPMRRWQAAKIPSQLGWPDPPRSRCWCCPNQADDEWADVLSRPDEWEAAVALERRVLAFDPHAFFHPQCVPLDQVKWEQDPKLPGFENSCSSGSCFV